MEEREYSEEEKKLIKEIQAAVDKIRPYIQHDGGDLEFTQLEKDKKIAHVRFWGACAACVLAQDDFSYGIQSFIMDEVPELENVVLDQPDMNQSWF